MVIQVDRGSIVELAGHARFRGVCGEGVVLNQAVGEVLVVSGVGLRVLELMAQDGAVEGIVHRLHPEYEVDEATLWRDVLAFLQAMIEAGAVQVREEGGMQT